MDGLLIALDSIDAVIDTIRRSRTADTARRNLMRKFKLTEMQATAILDMQLRRLASMERTKLKKERQQLTARIRYLEALLADEKKQLAVIREETAEIRQKHATSRRTTIVNAAPGENGAAVTCADLTVPDEPQMVTVTTKGILRCSASGYSYRIRTGASSRAVTAHRMRTRAEPTDEVLLVTIYGRAWLAPVGQVPEQASRSELGLAADERIVHLCLMEPTKCEVFALSEKGYLKRVSLAEFSLQGRGGKGMQFLNVTKATGPVTAAAADRVSRSTTVDVLARDQRRQRLAVRSIPKTRTRQSRGKKLVTIGPVSEIVLL